MKSEREIIGARLRFEVLRRCNFACYYCGVPAAMGVKQLHIDHVMPVSLGGDNHPSNLVAACWDCNAGKTNGVPTERLVREVRNDHCAYVESTAVVEAQPCTYCRAPVIREYEEEDPLVPDDHCGTCDELYFSGYDAGKVDGYKAGVSGGDILLPRGWRDL